MKTNPEYRELSPSEITTLQMQGCYSQEWERVRVSRNFATSQIVSSRLEGDIYLDSGAKIINSTLKNYHLCSDSRVESVTRMECRTRSRFGNGVSVATVNECGGRSINIYDSLTAQIAYVWAMFRHRGEFCRAMEGMVESYADSKGSEIGYIGTGAQVEGAKFIREVWVGEGCTIEGASSLVNGTLCAGAYVGVDVKAQDFITTQGSVVNTGATLLRCFVGENSIVANGFSAVDSLIFANCHLENGEAASIFAAPCTVSHHKSSLLIAGMFSFFNAGSGSNQSNHLFKTGAVHQAIHPRGCKFASGAYIMAPAVEGAYTMVKGHHSRHHDTLAFPFSYLINDGERSMLMPGANLVSYGTFRDIEKWQQRDKRTIKRDAINFEEHNPYITAMMITAVNTIHTLRDGEPNGEEYMWNRVVVKSAHLRRGLGLYNKAIASSIGAMLSSTDSATEAYDGSGEWIDAGGQYITLRAVEGVLSRVESGEISSVEGCSAPFEDFLRNYTSYARNYAQWLLGQLLGHEPSRDEISGSIASAQSSRESLLKMIESDKSRDCDLSMSVGYGLHDATSEADYRAVRKL